MKKLIAHYKKINRPDVVSALTRIRKNKEANYQGEIKRDTLSELLHGSFVWNETVETHMFWMNLWKDLNKWEKSQQTQ